MSHEKLYSCTRCKEFFPLTKEYFHECLIKQCHNNPKKKAAGICLKCAKKYYEENKKRIAARVSQNRKNQTGSKKKENQMFYQAYYRAKHRGLEFDIVVEDIIIPQYCPVFPDIELNKFSNKVSLNSPSLDRIDNTKGYIKGNIKVISQKANTLKSNGSIEDLQKLIDYMKGSP
jgi:hypothetical protein